MAEAPERYNVRVLDRTLRVLDLLSDGRRRTLTEISQALGISPSTAYRLLTTLERHRYVQRDPEAGGYRLGLACLELARAYGDANDLRRVALPELERLRDETFETVHLGVLDKMEVVYLEKLPGLHAIGLMSSRVGARAPAYCTAVGKAMLAFQEPEEVRRHFESVGLRRYTPRTITDLDALMEHLALVRERGYSLDEGEHEAEVRCVAAPLFDVKGRLAGAVSVSGPASRLEGIAQNRSLIERTMAAAREISRRLGHDGGRR